MKRILFRFIFCLFPLGQTADIYAYDKHYMVTTGDGLSNSSVNHIMSDSNGLMWISTWDGLNVYNGRTMKVFRSDPSDSSSLLDNIVKFVVQEDERYFWAVSNWGASRLDTWTGRFSRHNLAVDSGQSDVMWQVSMDVSSEKEIFCAMKGWGVALYDKEKDKMRPFNIFGLSPSGVLSLICLGKDRLVLNMDDGSVVIVRYSLDKERNVEAVVMKTILPESEHVYYTVGSDRYVYLIGEDHIYRYDADAGAILLDPVEFGVPVSYAAETPQGTLYVITDRSNIYEVDFTSGRCSIVKELCRDNLLCFNFGPEDMVWLSIDGVGMEARYNLDMPLKKISNTDIFGAKTGAVTSMVEADGGDIHVSTLGNGLFVLDPSGRFKKRIPEGVISSNRIFSMCKGPEGGLCVGMANTLDIYVPGSGIAYPLVRLEEKPQVVANCQYWDGSRNCLWVGTLSNGLYRFGLVKRGGRYQVEECKVYLHDSMDSLSISSNNILHIAPDDENHLWVGTLGGGLNRLDVETGRFERYLAGGCSGDMNNNNVRCILKYDQDVIYVGTSYGICRGVRAASGKMGFEPFGKADGLTDNTIHAMMKDASGRIWMSTNGGLSMFDPLSLRFTGYSGLDGLQSEEFYIHSCMSTSSGEMYFGGVAGLNHFYPEKMSLRQYSPKIMLDRFTVGKEERCGVGEGEVVLRHDENFFNIGFSALEYICNQNCEYAYCLEGFNNEWVTTGEGIAIFTNVPPGTYVFRVRSTNGDRVWCDNETTLAIKVLRPWWQTFGAYLLYVVVLTLLVLLVRRSVRIRQAQNAMIARHEAKLNFFTNVAHEFGTPLTLIACSGEQLSANITSGSREGRYVQIINDNAARMQNLIQELLEFRKVETGYYEPRYARIDPVAMLKAILDNFYEMGQRHAITAALSLPEHPFVFISDPSALDKILNNMISNAYKYTPDGGKVEVNLEEQDGGIHCVVKNTSKGMTQEKLKHVFDRFRILDTFEMQAGKGQVRRNGLGTALMSSLVEALGGTISVDSVVDKWVAFEFFLPSAREDQISANGGIRDMTGCMSQYVPEFEDMPYDDSRPVKDKGDSPCVMIVDDDVQICSLVADILSSTYRVRKAKDGQEAMELLAVELPDLVITDVDMPGMNGIEFLRKVKENELTRHIPVIILAFKTDVASEVDSYNLGSEAFISKPFLPQQLTAIVGSVLKNRTSLKDYYRSAVSDMEIFQGKPMNSKEKEFIFVFIRIVEENLTDDLSLAAIADRMCISEMTLYRRVKEAVGRKPNEFIRSIKLSRAADLLCTTDRTVQEIMYDCGFNNKSYFYRIFQQTYGMSPKEWRKSH